MKIMSIMKKISTPLFLAFTLFFVAFSCSKSYANRAAAAEIAYKWISDSTYQITYTLYRDCASATAEPASVKVCYYNTCNTDNGNSTLTKQLPLSGNGLPVQYACSGTGLTTCTGGTVRGYRKWVYEGTATLSSKCDSWRFVVSLDARNAGITNYTVPGTNPNLYSQATLNNVDAPKSSSPTFALDPIQYMCAGIPQNYSYSGTDADGDVLTYSIIDPSSDASNQTTCKTPATPTSYAFALGPLGGSSLATNPFATGGTFNLLASGTMSFTPTAALAQQPIMTMLITKRRGAKVVGSVTRDMQFVVSNTCTPDNVTFVVEPVPVSTAIFADPLGGPNYIVCPNVPFKVCFRISSTDPLVTISNVTDNSLAISSTTMMGVPYTGVGTNVVSNCMDWTPTEANEGLNYLIIRSQICKPGLPIKYRVDSIPIYVTLTADIVATDTMVCFGELTNVCGLPNFAAFPGMPAINYDWGIANPATGTVTGTLGITSPSGSRCTDVGLSTTSWIKLTTDLPAYCRRIDFPFLSTNEDMIKIVVVDPKINAGPDTIVCIWDSLRMSANLLNPQSELTYKYRWSPGTYMSDSTVQNPILKFPLGTDFANIPDSLVYSLTVTPYPDTTCVKTDDITVHFIKGYYIITGDSLSDITGLGHMKRQKGVSDTAICVGQSFALLGQSDEPNLYHLDYTWVPAAGVSTPNNFTPGVTTITPPGAGTFTYSVVGSRAGCRDSVKKVNVLVEAFPVVNVGDDKSICFGDTIQMAADITPSPDVFTGYKYSWSPGGALSRADTFITYFTGYLTTRLTLTVTTPAGCVGKDSVDYTVSPRQYLTKSADTIICPGDIANLSVAGDALLKSVTWKPLTDIDSIHALNVKVNPYFTTDYIVTAIDSNQCIDSAVIRVAVLPRAVMHLPDSVTIYPGDVYQIQPQGNALYYTWFPPSGLDFTNVANPKASPLLNTNYVVTASTDAGCMVKDSIYIFVAPDSYIDVPNAFVPGRSGENTIFKPVHLGDATLKSFAVYNRWGVKLFETTDINKGWDGSYSGQPQPMGVYVYVLEAVTAKGRIINKNGNVTLIR